jgi:hypothetical protein
MNESIPTELAREIARQGEARLEALMNLGIAADQRATALCGIFGASSIATVAAVLAYLSSSEHALWQLIWAGVVLALGLFVAALVAGFAGAPRDFYVAGGSPDILLEWSQTNGAWRDEAQMLEATASRYARHISANRLSLHKGARLVTHALTLAGVSPVLAVAAYFLLRC